MAQIVVGTAGHIDHGKTSLVKALTGTDTDHLSEEKTRGMTIDLGFAYLNESITIIDVPGHEKFIRNMAAGAANIHFGILVVAADDGVMPQTREHLDILTLLGVHRGIVALTKIDLIQDDEWLDLVELDVQELMASASFEPVAIHRINNLTGDGVNDLKNDILNLADGYSAVSRSEIFRLNVDRIFSKTGFGTIVTGTVQNGMISNGDDIELLPNGIKTKIRGIQTHGGQTDSAAVGDRAALNLLNIKPMILKRGTVLATPNCLKTTNRIIANLTLTFHTDWVVKNKQRLRFHFGTARLLGRVSLANKHQYKKGDSGNVLIDLESPVAVAMDDRFVVRSYSPMETIAGGIVLDPLPIGKWCDIKEHTLQLPLEPRSRFEYVLNQDWKLPKTKNEWQLLFFKFEKQINEWVRELNINESKDGILFSNKALEKGENELKSFFRQSYRQNPFRSVLSVDGITAQLKWSEQWLQVVIVKMTEEGTLAEETGGFSLIGFEPSFSRQDLDELKAIEFTLKKSGSEPILVKEIIAQLSFNPKRVGDLLHLLFDQGKAVNLGNNFWLNRSNLDQVIADMHKLFKLKNEMAVSDFKDLTGLSRKTAIPLLEYLDKKHYTIRNENVRLRGEALHG